MPGIAMQRQKAFVSLKIIVVGGSIGGLSAAYALQMAGHHVVLLEKEDGTKPVGHLLFIRSQIYSPTHRAMVGLGV